QYLQRATAPEENLGEHSRRISRHRRATQSGVAQEIWFRGPAAAGDRRGNRKSAGFRRESRRGVESVSGSARQFVDERIRSVKASGGPAYCRPNFRDGGTPSFPLQRRTGETPALLLLFPGGQPLESELHVVAGRKYSQLRRRRDAKTGHLHRGGTGELQLVRADTDH